MKLALLAAVTALAPCLAMAQGGQYPVMEKVAAKVVQKYQGTPCQQLVAEHGQKPTGQREQVEERAIQMLHQDPQMRQAFLNRVAGPIANKMFECGMIP